MVDVVHEMVVLVLMLTHLHARIHGLTTLRWLAPYRVIHGILMVEVVQVVVGGGQFFLTSERGPLGATLPHIN